MIPLEYGFWWEMNSTGYDKFWISHVHSDDQWRSSRSCNTRKKVASRWTFIFVLVHLMHGRTLNAHSKADHYGSVHGPMICRGTPIISHLLSTYDCFLFFSTSCEEATIMQEILMTYDDMSGQMVNYDKSKIVLKRKSPPFFKSIST